MFSPYYAWAGRRDPHDHVAANVALYGRGVRRWTMTERGRSSLDQGTDHIQIGRSRAEWRGDALVLDLDERASPLPRRVRGQVIVHPCGLTGHCYAIDTGDRHRWWPIAPHATVEARFTDPDLRFSGPGYLDGNAGLAPIERDFRNWDWSRAHGDDGETLIVYDVVERPGQDGPLLGLRVRADGTIEDVPVPGRQRLQRGFWGMGRSVRCEATAAPRVLQTLEDSPFYMRSVLETRLLGRDRLCVHESLSGVKVGHPIIRMMLPFKMPRRTA